MADKGSAYTDKELDKMEKKIQKIYAEAEKDIDRKISEFTRKFDTKNSMYEQMVNNGEITWEDYSHWLDGQIFQEEQWNAKKDQIIKVMQNANKEAAKVVNGGTIDTFAENANWSHYEMEHDEGLNFGFGLYDAHTVTNLVKKDPQLLPKWKINEKKDYKWNAKKVDNAITQGIIQGEDLGQITKRLTTALSATNRNTMLTFARTAMTGAQNAGRNQALMDAKELGIDVVKVWMATLDDHTRASHQEIDGEEQKVGDMWHPFKFSNGCRYPGDPLGPPHEVYNCRCTLVSDVKDYPSDFKRYDNIDGVPVDAMTYEEWKELKTQVNEDIPPIDVGPMQEDPLQEEKLRRIDSIMNSDTTAQMTDKQREEFETVLDSMSEEHLELYQTMTEFHDNNLYDYKGGTWYVPSRQRVEMDLKSNYWERVVGRTDTTGAWKDKFHEELHQLDHILANSFGYDNHGRGAITACESSWNAHATPFGQRLKEAISKDILGVFNRAIDNSNDANDNAAAMLGVKPAKHLKHITDLSKPISRDVKNAFFAYLDEQTNGDRKVKAMISPFTDAVGLMTEGRVDPYSKGYWGHKPSYQKEKGPNGATSECFAEIGSHIMRNDTEALDEIGKWMPNSISEYGDVLSEFNEMVAQAKDEGSSIGYEWTFYK